MEGYYKVVELDHNKTKLDIKETSFRNLRPFEVLIKTHILGISPADIEFIKSKYGNIKPEVYPLIPGFEASGEIVKVGTGVDKGYVGHRVSVLELPGSTGTFDGTWGEYLYASVSDILVHKKDIPYEWITFTLNSVTALCMFDKLIMSEVKSENKSEVKSEIKSENKSQIKSENKIENKSQIKSENKTNISDNTKITNNNNNNNNTFTTFNSTLIIGNNILANIFSKLCHSKGIHTINIETDHFKDLNLDKESENFTFTTNTPLAHIIKISDIEWQNEILRETVELHTKIAFDCTGGELASSIFHILPNDSVMYHMNNTADLVKIKSEDLIFKNKSIYGLWFSNTYGEEGNKKNAYFEEIKKEVEKLSTVYECDGFKEFSSLNEVGKAVDYVRNSNKNAMVYISKS